MSKYIKQTFSDILLLYKNFFHWNISKIIFLIYGILLGFLSIIPFLLIYLIYSSISGLDFYLYINSLISSKFLGDSFSNIIYVLTILSFGISYFYSYILLLKLNNSYLEKNKISYFKNDFFNLKLFLKYFGLSYLFIFIVFILTSTFFIFISFISIQIVGGIDKAIILSFSPTWNFFMIYTLFIFIAAIFIYFYLFYRFIFSYFILVESEGKNKKNIFTIIKEGFLKTKGLKKFIKFFGTFLLILLIYSPFYLTFSFVEGTYKDLLLYKKYMLLSEMQKSNIKLLDTNTYERLDIIFEGKDSKEINNLVNKYQLLNNICSIFKFLFINGVLLMFLNSYYKRIINNE